MLKAVRVQHQLGFNPYLWSGALPFLHADDVMLNSPFMDQKITPLMPAPGGDLLIDRMSSPEEAERLINGNVDLPALPQRCVLRCLTSTRVVIFVGSPGGPGAGIDAVGRRGALLRSTPVPVIAGTLVCARRAGRFCHRLCRQSTGDEKLYRRTGREWPHSVNLQAVKLAEVIDEQCRDKEEIARIYLFA